MKIDSIYSPNFNRTKRSKKSIKIIVIHYTGMQSERESIIRLCNPQSKASSHFLINQNGKVYRLVQDNRIAWHAGKSCWKHYTNFRKKQLSSLIKICKTLIKRYKIKKKNIVGHSDIAPLRKIDPGEKFPWKQLAKKNIGIWHGCKPSLLRKFRRIKIFTQKDKVKFVKNLNNIGYCFSVKKKSFFIKTVKAFQRRYRKELVNGLLDKECLIIAQNLSKKTIKNS